MKYYVVIRFKCETFVEIQNGLLQVLAQLKKWASQSSLWNMDDWEKVSVDTIDAAIFKATQGFWNCPGRNCIPQNMGDFIVLQPKHHSWDIASKFEKI